MQKLNVAVVGFGYWGPNLARNFYQMSDARLHTVCDLDEVKRQKVSGMYPDINVTDSFEEILGNDDIEAVVVATPVSTHAPLGVKVLEAGKHLFVEKPMADSIEAGKKLTGAAEDNDRILMVGHTFEYVPTVNRIKQILDSGELGDIRYIHAQRLNLGLYQEDINVIWDLAPHDISIMNFLMEERPVSVSAQANCHAGAPHEDVSVVALNYPGDVTVYLHLSWLDPNKVRKTTIVGSDKMLVYDDIEPLEKVKIYDKGVITSDAPESYAEFQMSYRYGDIYIPKVDGSEPLRVECEHFIDCIKKGNRPKSDGINGLNVVAVLEAIDRSVEEGAKVELEEYYEAGIPANHPEQAAILNAG